MVRVVIVSSRNEEMSDRATLQTMSERCSTSRGSMRVGRSGQCSLIRGAGSASPAGSVSSICHSAFERDLWTVYDGTLANSVALLADLPASTPVERFGISAEFTADLA
jgi:hypothetical protein